MIDGTYSIELDGLLGRKTGRVDLRSEDGKAIADIDAPLVGKQHVEGVADGDAFTAEGEFKLGLLGKISYSLRGEVTGDDLNITIDSSKGVFTLDGKRV